MTVLKRLALLGLMLGMLSACGSVGPMGETPSAVLAAAADKSKALKSFSVAFDASESFPATAAMLSGLGAFGAGGNQEKATVQVALKGTVKVVKPDRIALDGNVKFNGLALDFSTVTIGSDTYTRDLFTGQWKKSTRTGSGAADSGKRLESLDPATFSDLVKYLTVEDTLADTDLDGVHVHHYKVKIDGDKLKAELTRRGVLKAGTTTQAFDAFIKKDAYKMQVWVGTSDHLVRRVTIDIDTITDASVASGFSLGASPSSGPQSHVVRPAPSPQPVHVTGHAQLDFSDFDKPLDIKPPPVG